VITIIRLLVAMIHAATSGIKVLKRVTRSVLNIFCGYGLFAVLAIDATTRQLENQKRATRFASHPLAIDHVGKLRQPCFAPHSGQNLGLPSIFAPHSEQNFSRLMACPHSPQNLAFGAILAPQFGHAPTTVFSNFSLVT
jgi:hypothetical protein